MKKVIAVVAITSLIAFGSVLANDSPQRQPKSPGLAATLSFMGTVVPVTVGLASADEAGAILFLGGIWIGPGLGHLYAANVGRFFLGLGLRTVGFVAVGAALAASLSGGGDSGGDAAGMAGVVLLGGVSLIDIIGAAGSARKYNKKHGLAGVDISPTYFASQKAFGVQVSLGF